ncbi:MAG: CRTAC1 family protein [Acidobacteriota bacterium]
MKWSSLNLLLLTLAGNWTVAPRGPVLVTGESIQKPLPATTPGGIAVFDYNNDGRLDLFFPNGGALPRGPKAPNTLLRNDGNFQFSNVTAAANLSGHDYDLGAAAGDYDHDGHPDLLTLGLRGITLYRNLGNGRFTNTTAAARLDNRGRWSVAAAWFDMDNDGDLDLFVVNYVQWNPATEQVCLVAGKPDFCHPRHYAPQANALFRNNGDGTFSDISAPSGIAAHQGKGMSVAAADFDADGLTDLYVTNDRAPAFYFRNLGHGQFEECAFDRGVAVPQDGRPVSGMGVNAEDYDNDGRPDLVYTALRDETFPLYRNRGHEFEEVTGTSRLAPLTRAMAGWGIAFADLDNDGWKDILAARSDALSATGGYGAKAKEPPAWFRNQANGAFAPGAGWAALEPAMYRGLVAADLNADGCLDVVLTALQATPRLLRHPCQGAGNWLSVDVREPGARVRIGNQTRWVSSATGYASSYLGPLHFGLGPAQQVDVEVTWPDGRSRRVATATNRAIQLKP